MRIVSPFLKKIVYPTLAMSGVFRRIAAEGLAVVTYHGVLPERYKVIEPALDGNLVTAETFRRQLRCLKSHYNVISPADVLAWLQGERPLPARAVLLTCDDGLLNNLTEMLPILQQENLQCLFFVTGISTNNASDENRGMLWYEKMFLLLLQTSVAHFEIGSSGITISGELGIGDQRRSAWWSLVKRLSQVDAETRESLLSSLSEQLASSSWRAFDTSDAISSRRFGLMTSDALRQLATAGMTIGAHTLSHPMLSQLPLDVARAEIADSRVKLETVLSAKVWAFAYPFGDPESVAPQVLEMPEAAGYSAAFLNYGGGLGASLPRFALPRIHVTAEMSPAELEAHVSGLHTQLQRSLRR